MDQTIFKSYDIRGIFPKEIDAESARTIGRAFVAITGAKNVALCRDARLSGKELSEALAKGITEAGANVCEIGLLPTECLYFAVGNYEDIDAGIMVTASHNPKEYNGFKMLKKSGGNIEIIRGKELLSAIGTEKPESAQTGQILQREVLDDFLKHIFSLADISNIKPFSIVVDCSSGAACNVVPKLMEKFQGKAFLLNYEPDGNFPNHSPNPLEKGSVTQTAEEIKGQKADFGFIFDGDADRIFLVDENGNLVRADVTLLLMARAMLKKYPKSAVAYNAICSKAVSEFILKWQGKPVRTQVGFVNVRDGLIKEQGSMGGELSGHYCFKDNFYLDSGMASLLTILQTVSESNKKISELALEFSPYAKSSEINFKIENKQAVLDRIKEKYTDGRQDFLDGITVEYTDWWFNVRASNTESLLRLTIEAETELLLEIKTKELSDFITSPF